MLIFQGGHGPIVVTASIPYTIGHNTTQCSAFRRSVQNSQPVYIFLLMLQEDLILFFEHCVFIFIHRLDQDFIL